MADTDKLVYLPQLQRYDEKLKRWVNNEYLALAPAAATDVRIAGKSITVDGVADIPLASTTQQGVMKYDPYGGLITNERGLSVDPAVNSQIDNRNASNFAIVADSHLDYAVKAAMCDGKGAAWTVAEQAAAKERMGIGDYSLPKATTTTLGGVKVGNGLNVTDDGTLSVETHSSETLITTSITATYDNTGTWNTVCKDTYDVIVSWFDNYDRVFAFVNSGANSLRPFPRVFVELIKVQERLIVSTPFTIQYVVPSNNPLVRTGMTTTALCQIYFNANGSINFQMSYSEVDQYADATEFTNTVNEGVSMLALKDGGITSAKLSDGAVTADKIASDVAKQINNGNNAWVQWSGETSTIGTAMTSGCTAYAWGNVVTVACSGVSVPGNQKTQIGTLGAQYAPPVTVTGLVASSSSGSNRTGYLQVDTSGNVFINMATGQSQTEDATGVLTFLIA